MKIQHCKEYSIARIDVDTAEEERAKACVGCPRVSEGGAAAGMRSARRPSWRGSSASARATGATPRVERFDRRGTEPF